MVAKRFEELECWQLANELKLRVYSFISTPVVARDFDYCNQIRDSARGAPRTIAEGFGRFRNTEFARYLEFARASLMETQNHLKDGRDSGYLNASELNELNVLANRALGATTGLHRYLRSKKASRRCREEPRSRKRARREP